MEQEEKQGYVPRPRYQVWGARVLLAGFVVLVALYYLRLAGWL